MKTSTESQYDYCPQAWMFHNRHISTGMNKLHEKALRAVYKDEKVIFEQFLEKDNSSTIYEREFAKTRLKGKKLIISKRKFCDTQSQNRKQWKRNIRIESLELFKDANTKWKP